MTIDQQEALLAFDELRAGFFKFDTKNPSENVKQMKEFIAIAEDLKLNRGWRLGGTPFLQLIQPLDIPSPDELKAPFLQWAKENYLSATAHRMYWSYIQFRSIKKNLSPPDQKMFGHYYGYLVKLLRNGVYFREDHIGVEVNYRDIIIYPQRQAERKPDN